MHGELHTLLVEPLHSNVWNLTGTELVTISVVFCKFAIINQTQPLRLHKKLMTKDTFIVTSKVEQELTVRQTRNVSSGLQSRKMTQATKNAKSNE